MRKTWLLIAPVCVAILGFNADRVIAAPPPYDSNPENKLIDQKPGKPNPGDPQWLVDGKFYDVGRNPDPVPGETQTDYGDYRFRVTHIKFDYSPDVGAGDEPGEGLELWYDSGTSLKHPLENRIKGEWIYKWADDSAAGRNEPALYACKEKAKIKVRIECADPIASAEIGAKQVLPPGGQRPDWRDVERTRVEFIEVPPGSGRYVSKGPVDPVSGPTEYVEMKLLGEVRDDINKTECSWQWYVDGTSAAGTPPGTPRYARKVCNNSMEGWEINRSEGYKIVNDVEVAVPHTFYTVLGKPKEPYYREFAPGPLYRTFPWVNALEFAIVTNIRLAGESDERRARRRITEYCFAEYALAYDHANGAPRFLDADALGNMASNEVYFYDFQQFILRGAGARVNCVDQACSVSALIDLVTGVDAEVVWLTEFGYVGLSNFVGKRASASCNNPFFLDPSYVSTPAVGSDDTFWRLDASGKRKRSFFAFHTWVKCADGLVYDATLGPGQTDTSPPDPPAPELPTIEGTMDAYRQGRCDVSKSGQAGMEWRDDEKVAVKQMAYIPLSPVEPWLVAGYTDAQYQIEVAHADFTRVRTRAINLYPR